MKSIILLYLLLMTNFLLAQEDDLKFIHLSTDHGLSNSDGNSIVQDKEGFIWIATSDGLNRYDGRSFKVYRKSLHDSTSIQNNNIKYLFIDSRGELWIGTDRGGVCRYDKKRDCFVNYLNRPGDSSSIYNNLVTSITEDFNHDIWVGSYGCLHLFNRTKNNFIRFTENPVLTITDQGIKDIKSKITSKAILNYLELNKGKQLYYSTLYNYLKNLGNDALQKYSEILNITFNTNGIASSNIRVLTLDKKGYLWIGYGNGIISRLDPKTKKFRHYKFVYPNAKTIIDFLVTSICVDNDKLWIGTRGEGTWIFDTNTGQCEKFTRLPELMVNTIIKDKKGDIWIGGAECGVVRFDPKRNFIFQYKHNEFDKYSLSTNNISSIYEDRQGNFWIGVFQGDVNITSKYNPFHGLKEGTSGSGGLSHSSISAFMEDDDNSFWVGYYNIGSIDIINIKNNSKRHIAPSRNSKSGLEEGSVHSIFKDSRGNIWIGTYLGGLRMYDKKTGRVTAYINNPSDLNTISGNDVRKIAEDKEGNIWIAIHGSGVDKLNLKAKSIEHYKVDYNNLQKTISGNWVYTVFCDNNDNIWVGSINGISVINKKSNIVKHYINQPGDDKSLSNNFVLDIFQDSKGNMWFGTAYGLNLLDPKTGTFKVYTQKDGLPNDNITGIQEDDHGDLWLSTFKGLSRFTSKVQTFKNFDVLDGLITDEFLLPNGFKNKNGEIFFWGRQGIVFFKPEDVKTNEFLPPVYITDFKLFNQSVEVLGPGKKKGFYLDNQMTFTKELTLRYNQNVFTFEFVALNYIRPEKNQYAYKMEGFDRQWNKIGSKNDVTYTNLPPGNYTFRVKAANNDGIWNETGTSIKLIITPPWWRTIFAYCLYVIIIILLLVFFRYRIIQREKFEQKVEMEREESKRLHEMDLMKLRFFANISHEFRTPLTLIIAPLEKLIRSISEEKLQIQIKLIYRNAIRLLRLVNQLMDIRKLEAGGLKLEATKDDLIRFVKDIANSFSFEAHERNIDFGVTSDEKILETWFDSDKIDMVFYNLIANAFKYTPDGGKISVIIKVKYSINKEVDKKHIEIIVEDTGIGIPPESLPRIFDRFYQVDTSKKSRGTGIGLSLTKEVIELHHGEVSVESDMGKGTRFIVVLPLDNEYFEKYQLVNSSLYVVVNEDNTISTNFGNFSPPETDGKTESEGSEKLPILLVVEDDVDLRLFIKQEFKNSFKIIEAPNGNIGFEKATLVIPDLIISDIMMPGMDGNEMCKKLKTTEQTSHVPIVLLTALSNEDQIVEGLETGADDYITKPFSISVLRARVKNLIESRRMLRNQYKKMPDNISQTITPTTLDQKFLERSFKIIEQNISNSEFDAHQFATEIGMSRSQLYRKVQALTGYSVNELIRNIRLKKAAELLTHNNYNVTEASFAVGFNDATYFIRCFSGYFGTTPAKYKSMQKIEGE